MSVRGCQHQTPALNAFPLLYPTGHLCCWAVELARLAKACSSILTSHVVGSFVMLFQVWRQTAATMHEVPPKSLALIVESRPTSHAAPWPSAIEFAGWSSRLACAQLLRREDPLSLPEAWRTSDCCDWLRMDFPLWSIVTPRVHPVHSFHLTKPGQLDLETVATMDLQPMQKRRENNRPTNDSPISSAWSPS